MQKTECGLYCSPQALKTFEHHGNFWAREIAKQLAFWLHDREIPVHVQRIRILKALRINQIFHIYGIFNMTLVRIPIKTVT